MPIARGTLATPGGPVNRTPNTYGVGEVITLGCNLFPHGTTAAAFGGVLNWSVLSGGGAVTGNTGVGGAVYTAPDTASTVKLALSRADNMSILFRKTIKIVAPNGVQFSRHDAVTLHTNGMAGAGFRAHIKLLPNGVSFNNVQIREGSFKAKGSGAYANEEGREHATGAWVPVANFNHVGGVGGAVFDTVRAADTAGPDFEAGEFNWNIPWQYRVAPAGDAHHIDYVVHKQTVNLLGHVTILKGGITVSADVNDPNGV